MAKKSTNWFGYVNTIVATIGTGEFQKLDDQKTYNVMLRVVDGLMSKGGIGGSVLNAFVTNIRVRAGEREFSAEGPIYLTRHQQTHARKMNWHLLPALSDLRAKAAEQLPDAECSRNDADDLVPIPHPFRIDSAAIPRSFRAHSAKMPRKLAEELEFWWLNEMCQRRRKSRPLGGAKPGHLIRVLASAGRA